MGRFGLLNRYVKRSTKLPTVDQNNYYINYYYIIEGLTIDELIDELIPAYPVNSESYTFRINEYTLYFDKKRGVYKKI